MSDTGLKPKARVDGRHELVERLDDRGAGEAWKARDPDFKTRLALLKVLGPLPAGAGSVPAALVDLARRLRAVRHPCLLPVTGVGAHGGRSYVALAWFEGASLAAALREGDAPSLDALARAFDALAEGLAACHEAGVVHGGVTPGCVLAQRGAGGEFEVRLADVGLAPFADQGTAFLYEDCVAPEVRAGHAPGAAADVFGLGATLRRALAVPPDASAWVEPAVGFRGREDVPKAVWDLVEQATRADPAARHESVAQMRTALTEAWRDDARLPVRYAQGQADEGSTSPRADPDAAPRMLWDVPAAPPAPREPAFDEQQTTYKLTAVPKAEGAAPAGPLSLDALLGDASPAPASPSAPPAAPVPTGAQNPWSTDVLRREVNVPAPADLASTQVDRREPTVAPAPVAPPPAAPSPFPPGRSIVGTEVANPEQLRAVQAMAAQAMTPHASPSSSAAPPKRAGAGLAVAVVALLLVAVVAALAFAR